MEASLLECVLTGYEAIYESGEILAANEYITSDKKPKDEFTEHDMHVREVAKSIKSSISPYMKEAAYDIAKLVSSDSILVPIPSSSGDRDANMKLAQMIAEISGASIVDALNVQKPRESTYQRYKSGKPRIPARKMGLVLSQPIYANRVLFIDNVASSGASIQAAINLINGGKGLVYAKS